MLAIQADLNEPGGVLVNRRGRPSGSWTTTLAIGDLSDLTPTATEAQHMTEDRMTEEEHRMSQTEVPRITEEPCGDERKPRRGRPLDAGVDDAILKAASALLEERGYDKLTMKDLAERAGVGLGAIYRRWRTKDAVTIAALKADADWSAPLGITGDAVEDLTQALLRDVQGMEDHITSFVSAMRHHPELATAVRDAFVVPRQAAFAEILACRFDDPEECAVRAEMALAIPLSRLLLGIPLPKPQEIRTRLVPLVMGLPLSSRSDLMPGVG